MVWNKLKKKLEEFLTPGMIDHIKYMPSGYRYNKMRQARCHLKVDGKELFNMNDASTGIRWYQTEQEVKSDPTGWIHVTEDDVEAMRQQFGPNIPEERLMIVARDRKISQYAKDLIDAQKQLEKTDFLTIANTFMTTPIDQSLMSDGIMLNILAMIDRRVGKNRLNRMRSIFEMKHPVVRYIYNTRLGKPSLEVRKND